MTSPALHLDILPAAQRRLWDELVDVPGSFVLYGGTAIALHLRHRQSVDFDLFGSERFDPDVLYRTLPFLSGSLVVQKSPDPLTCVVERGGNVQISFFEDGDLGTLPNAIRNRLAAAVRAVDLDQLPAPSTAPRDPGCGR